MSSKIIKLLLVLSDLELSNIDNTNKFLLFIHFAQTLDNMQTYIFIIINILSFDIL